MIVSPGEFCLQCRYSLKGLSRPHRCPECGLPFDGETILFRPRTPQALYGGLFMACLMTMQSGFHLWIAPPGSLRRLPLAIVGVGASAIVLAVFWIRRSKATHPYFAALTHDAVLARTGGGTLQRIAYADIAYVEHSMQPSVVAKDAAVSRQDQIRTPKSIELTGMFDGKDEAATFDRMLRERIARG